jgi:hypothetical protein
MRAYVSFKSVICTDARYNNQNKGEDNMKTNKKALGIGLATVALIGMLPVASASAQTPPQGTDTTPRPVRIMGRVDTVTGNGLTMTTRRGPVTANVGTNTWIVVERDQRCVEGTLQDIQPQRPATVAGMTTGQPGVINARVVTQGRCGHHSEPGKERPGEKRSGHHVAAGSIKAINGSNITIATERGQDVTLITTANTAVLNNGFKAVGTLKVGDKVEVIGGPVKGDAQQGQGQQAQRAINALAIRVVSDNTRLVTGHVESMSGNSLVLRTPANRDGITVTLDGSTGYKAAQASDRQVTLTNATQADVKVGSVLTIEGVASSDGKSMAAKAVIIMPGEGKQRPGGR